MTEDQIITKKRKFCREFVRYQGEWKRASDATGVSVATIKHWMKKDPDFNDRIYNIEQQFVDEVERALIAKVREGDVRAMIFYLKCKGKDRGYIDRVDNARTIEEMSHKEYKLDFGDGEDK